MTPLTELGLLGVPRSQVPPCGARLVQSLARWSRCCCPLLLLFEPQSKRGQDYPKITILSSHGNIHFPTAQLHSLALYG